MRKEHDSRTPPMPFVEKSRNWIVDRQISTALVFVFRYSCTNRTDNSKSYRFRRTSGKVQWRLTLCASEPSLSTTQYSLLHVLQVRIKRSLHEAHWDCQSIMKLLQRVCKSHYRLATAETIQLRTHLLS